MARTLRLGLIPVGHGEGLARARDFANALAHALRAPIELHRAGDYRALVAALGQGVAHFAWLPPLSAARASQTKCIVPAAVAIRNGSTSYMTGLIALRDSPVRSIADLKGVRAAWVDRESASGYVIIRAALRASGVRLADAFSEEMFVRSHAEVARAVRTRRADVGATCFNVVNGDIEIARTGFEDDGNLADSEVHLIAHAGPIPSDIFAVHTSLPDRERILIERAMAGHDEPAALRKTAKALMHADGFARPTRAHMGMLDRLFETVG